MSCIISELARPAIRHLTPYSSARHEASGFEGSLFLDANEQFWPTVGIEGLNRYPDPFCEALKAGYLKYLANDASDLTVENLFVGCGSDEAISLLINIFCDPTKDNIVITPPTYGMYQVSADIFGVPVRNANLQPDFALDSQALSEAITEDTKLVFICCPNNPTSNAFETSSIFEILANPRFRGLLVIDEAYQEFSKAPSFVSAIAQNERLVVLRTFSKAFGLASARVGLALADSAVIELLNRTKPPYNVPGPSQNLALKALSKVSIMEECRDAAIRVREIFSKKIYALPSVTVYPSEANFLLIRVPNADEVYRALLARGIIVRNRNSDRGCENCLRITIGNEDQMDWVYNSMKEILGV